MKAYIDTRFFTKEEAASLDAHFKTITFIKDMNDATEAEVAIVTPQFVTKEHIKTFKNLKWIQLLTAGYDNAELSAIKNQDVILTNALDVFSIQIAEDVLSKILLINRQLKGQIKHMSQGLWQHIPVTHELYGSTVGIIGTGSIGKEVAKRLKPFEVTILGYRTKSEPVLYFDQILTSQKGLNQLIEKSDYIIIAIPLSDKTHHLLNKENMKQLKHDVVIINVARGEIIDQDALVSLLREQKVRGVGLDVTTPEPLPSDHILWTFDQVTITPHNASSSPYMSTRLLDVVKDNIERYLQKEDLRFVVKID
ncbi:MAG: D-2-hydroxyacid dehydrogenase [Acholeplasmataceae bacterium]